jgi:transposase-like protein
MGITKLKTCKSCGHDNPDNARSCNSCAASLTETGLFTKTGGHHKRWVCPDCNRINMEENKKCSCGYKRGMFS